MKKTSFVAVIKEGEHPLPWRPFMYSRFPPGELVVVSLSYWGPSYKSWQVSAGPHAGYFLPNESIEIIGEL